MIAATLIARAELPERRTLRTAYAAIDKLDPKKVAPDTRRCLRLLAKKVNAL
jgi:hypothetical protein